MNAESVYQHYEVPPLIVNGQTIGHPGGPVQVEDFIACVRENREPFCNGEVALKAMAVTFAAEESVRRQQYVPVDTGQLSPSELMEIENKT
jgi:hypothetical protein